MQRLADGRVRRTRSEWRQILEAFEASGLSISAFCQREGLSRGAFTRWRGQLQEVEPAVQGGFVELPVHPQPSSACLAPGELELSLPGGAILRWRR